MRISDWSSDVCSSDLLPEALHQVTIVMSDRGIPASYRNMHGFGSRTYSFWNEQGERYWVKFHFRTQQGIKNITDAKDEQIVGNEIGRAPVCPPVTNAHLVCILLLYQNHQKQNE